MSQAYSLFMKKIIPIALKIIRSRKFFLIIVGLLVLQATWIALSARYPMAFDENFHFGIIKIYAHQLSPFFASAPPDSAAYGDLVRNPSYLYQYLMSFPYRFIALFIHSEAIQVIILRFINIGLFAAGLFAFRKLLLRLRISPGITNLSLLMLVCIPVVPFLAGQINYDNLLFLLIPIITLLALTCGQSISKTGHLPAVSFITLLVMCMLSSLVKYAFLPIFLALMAYLIIIVIYRKNHKIVFARTWQSFRSLKTWTKIILIISLVVAGGLFAERYGVNLIKYHSLQPDCAKIETLDQCLQYGPWGRNYTIKANLQAAEAAGDSITPDPSGILFLPNWVAGMVHRLYFAINYDYINYYGLPIPIGLAAVIGFVGIILFAIFCRSMFRNNRQLFLIALVSIVYILSLLYVNYTDYLKFKTMLAINGRYLILVLPFVFAFLAIAYRAFIDRVTRKHAATYKVGLMTIVLLLTLQGGGVLTFIIRSDTGWYWKNQTVINANTSVKKAISPLIVGASHRVKAE